MNKMGLHQCYRLIIQKSLSRVGQRGQMIDYAASYAKTGLGMPDAVEPAELTEASRSQALYVRTNLGGWRGDEARAVRWNIDRILKR